MGRRAVDDGRPDDTIWKGKKLYFKKRYPVEITNHRADWPKFLERSLKTGDISLARVRAAACLIEYHDKCKAALTPQAPQSHDAWLKSLTPTQRAQVIAIGDARTGDSYGAAISAEEAISRLSIEFFQTEWAATQGAPIASLASALMSDDAKARIQEAVRAEIMKTTAPDAAALIQLGYPARELPPSVRNAVDALAEAAKAKTLAHALALRTQDMGEDRYRGQIEWAHRLFEGIIGDKPLTALKTGDLTTFENELRKMPVSVTVRNAIAKGKMTVREALDCSKEGTPTLTPQAIAKHVSFIRALSKLAYGKGLAGDRPDPFAPFLATRIKKSKARKHFTTAELEKLFAEMQRRWLSQHPDRVWISLIALFHGTRREEICQLLKTDIKEVQGVWCMQVTTTVPHPAFWTRDCTMLHA